MADLRGRVIHGYDVVDLRIVWRTATHDLPLLVSKIQQILIAIDSDT